MVKKKLAFIFLIFYLFFSQLVHSATLLDQWVDSEKTYKDLIQEGFKIKGYDAITIEASGGIVVIMFVTVLEKNNEVFECQEYQTLDKNMETLDLSIICRELVQPYLPGLGT
tara:strand:- start:15730 stop:16065 length:336 start_codon:yes stop_codon:yes gene_type:complete